MLVLTRKKGETIIIGDDIEITVLDIKGEQVRVGIKAPKDVSILRNEIYLAIKEENQSALKTGSSDLSSIEKMIKEKRNM